MQENHVYMRVWTHLVFIKFWHQNINIQSLHVPGFAKTGFAKTVYLPKRCKRHVSEKTTRKGSASHLRKMPLMLGVLRKAEAETELILLFCRWRNSRDSGRSGGTCDKMLPERSSVWNTHKTSSSLLFLHIARGDSAKPLKWEIGLSGWAESFLGWKQLLGNHAVRETFYILSVFLM